MDTFVVVLLNITISMVKKVMILCVSLLGLVACSKDNDLDSSQVEKVQVKFNVKALDVDVQPMNAPMLKSAGLRAAASSVLTDIQYCFYNAATNEIVKGSQSIATNAANFGELSVMLAPGNYDVFFLGNTANNPGGTLSVNFSNSFSSDVAFSVFDKEVFYTKTNYAITNTSTSEDVNLSRLVGKLVLQLNDTEVPSYVGKIKVEFGYLPRFRPMYNESTTTPTGYALSSEKNLSFTSSGIDEMGVYLLPQTSRTMKITVCDSSNAELASTQVVFNIYSNKRTIIQGNIFDVINNRGFNITVSDEWDEDVVIPL